MCLPLTDMLMVKITVMWSYDYSSKTFFKDTYAGRIQYQSKLSSQHSSSQSQSSTVQLLNGDKPSRHVMIRTFSQIHVSYQNLSFLTRVGNQSRAEWTVSSHWAPSPECNTGLIPPIRICSLHAAGQPSSLSIQTHLHVVIVHRLQRNLIASTAHTKPTWDTGPASHCEPLFPMNHGQRWERKARREQNRRERAGGAKPDSVSEVTEPKPVARAAEIKVMYAVVFCMSLLCNTMFDVFVVWTKGSK